MVQPKSPIVREMSKSPATTLVEIGEGVQQLYKLFKDLPYMEHHF